jgi:alanine-glyoxylate transaminase/serine-glyoxylate transaminase/serine-pyruvate transaminase
MSLSQGISYFAGPGPSVLPERVLRAMMRPSPNIYTGALPDLTDSLVPDLKTLAGTEGHLAMYISNGHGLWEAALANTMSRGDKVLVLVTGRFGLGWEEMAQGLLLEPEIMDFGEHSAIDAEAVRARLAEDRGQEIKAVLAVYTDTSTGLRSEIAPLSAAIRDLQHPALLMVDAIASFGCDRLEMDAWGIDVLIAASQKGLMTPPGMGFVWFNERADARREDADCASVYWDWRPRSRPEIFYQYWDGTAPTHQLFALREAVDMILEEGLEHVWQRHATLAQAAWAAVDNWAQNGDIALNVPVPSQRSHAVTSVRMGSGAADRLRAWCEAEAGLTLGLGLGRTPAEDYLRIGHMGHINAHMMLGILGTMEAGLSALGIAHGRGGVLAAADVISGALSE